MNRKQIQFVLLAFAILSSILLLRSQAEAKVVVDNARAGQFRGAAVVSGAGAAPGALSANFGPPANFPAGNGNGNMPYGVAAGNFNRDGNLDAITATSTNTPTITSTNTPTFTRTNTPINTPTNTLTNTTT